MARRTILIGMKPSELQAPTDSMLPAALKLLGIDPDETHVRWYITEERESRFAVAAPVGLLVYEHREVVPHRPDFRLSLVTLTPWRDVRCLIGSTTRSGRGELASGLSLTIDGLPDRINGYTNQSDTTADLEFAVACVNRTLEAKGAVTIEAENP